MPIKPPNLDDRRYAEIVEEARSLIPQYCPEWTNFSASDPGITLVQLFAWMTELIIYRLNRVPDKTYVHFLNFIGEERKRARPAVAPLTLALRSDRNIELQPFSRFATRQTEEKQALQFLSVAGLTVHDSRVRRVMAVKGGSVPAVRELPMSNFQGHSSAITFGEGRGIQFFDLDPVEYGPDAFTPFQFFYIAHDDFRLMDIDPEEGRPVGRLRIRRASEDDLSIASLFRWEYPTAQGWRPIATERDEDAPKGVPEDHIITALPGIVETPFDAQGADVRLPEKVAESMWWIRGRLDFERWLAECMLDDLEISWKDDRGGEDRAINNWQVRANGRTLEFFLQDVPPIRGGWTIRYALVDRGMPAGRNSYLPRYRWYFRRGETWERIPQERVRTEGTQIVLTGPLTDMATDGYNIRAERIETVFIRGFVPDLDVDLNWMRPVEVHLKAGDDVRRLEDLLAGETPYQPFQIAPVIPPTIGRKLFIGSDLFENRRQAPVLIELEVAFEMNGEVVEEPKDLYRMQLTYRAEDSWRVVWTEDKIYSGFTFAELDEEGAKRAARRKIRLVLDPKTQLKGLARHTIGDFETTWLRLELIKSSLTGQDETKTQHPISVRFYDVQLGADKTLGDETYEQPLPGPRMAQLDYREQNQRLTRLITRATGRLNEFFPFFPFVEIAEENQSVYIELDKPLPPGNRHAMHFRCRGEAFLPDTVSIEWELLAEGDHGRTHWERLAVRDHQVQRVSLEDGEKNKGRGPYDLSSSGVLDFSLPEVPKQSKHGFWLRGRFTWAAKGGIDTIPPLPPVTHLMLNTVNVVNLTTMRTERYSGLGVPNQAIQLLRKPIFLHHGEGELPVFQRPELFLDIKVVVEKDDFEQEEWTQAEGNSMLTATKDDRVYTVDPVEGTLTFGNGIRGRMLPVGSNNIIVDTYRVVPGAKGNVGPHAIVISEGYGDAVECSNLLPATGGRDAETIEEIVRRAPSILTSRDRAVTRSDFEVIAMEASGEVARAACNGRMDEDGQVEVVILPLRREGEGVPDPFLSHGLRDHVSEYLKRRCLINVDPVVRLAAFMRIDVSLTLRLRPNANVLQVREKAEHWVARFLDPYQGGLDSEGWPFQGTLYAQDFARMVTDIDEVRHVMDVELFDMSKADPRAVAGWEEGHGNDELVLAEHDLFVVRRIRIGTEEAGQ